MTRPVTLTDAEVTDLIGLLMILSYDYTGMALPAERKKRAREWIEKLRGKDTP